MSLSRFADSKYRAETARSTLPDVKSLLVIGMSRRFIPSSFKQRPLNILSKFMTR